MRRKVNLYMLVVMLVAGLWGCSGASSSSVGETNGSAVETVASNEENDEARKIYDELMAAENVTVEEAYEQLKDVVASEDEIGAFQTQLGALIGCSGQFIWTSEDGDSYTADVEFYLVKGQIYCSVDYTGYMGDIRDGTVDVSKEADYQFESFTKGDLFSNEQDFTLYFSPDQIRILWADDCDYTLTRDNNEYSDLSGEVKLTNSIGMGQWLLKGFQMDGKLVLLSMSEALESMYGDRYITLSGDGTYSYKNGIHIEEGVWAEADTDKEDTLLVLERRTISTYEMEKDEVKKKTKKSILTSDAGITADDPDALLLVDGDTIWIFEREGGNSSLLDRIENSANSSSSGTEKDSEDSVSGSSSTGSGGTLYGGSTSGSTGSSSSYGNPTTGEKNALDKALQYLDYTAFSYTGLIDQLEYEGFTTSEATYGADHCGADWNEQAVKKAREYLDFTSFSRSGLVEQLEYEGFTNSQAEYAVDIVY